MTPDAPAPDAFDHSPRTRIVFGAQSSARVGKLAAELGAHRVLVVTDAGIVRAGHAGRIAGSLRAEGLGVAIFDAVRENPTTLDVARCVEVARAASADLLIGLGGGSSMDTAKGCNFILTNGGEMRDYWGVGKATKPMLPLIAIPTTAGTGSECQCAALIADEQTHQKMACLDPKAAARVALLDPVLTLSQPPRVTACTGIDAIAHAVESAVTRKRNAISWMYSREAFRLCAENFTRVLENPADVEARGGMLLGAALAGLAIENSMLGAAHAAANPLTAVHGVVHGEAVGMLLPHVIRFNAAEPACARHYAELATAAGLSNGSGAAEVLAKQVEAWLDRAKLARSLAGTGNVDTGALGETAANQWTAGFNPRPVSATDFREIYRAIAR